MLGKRLEKANDIARKRARRWKGVLPFHLFRKWNQTCSCWACRKPRYDRHRTQKELYPNNEVE